jgi:hypothetical protein
MLIQEQSPQTEAWRPALPKSERDEPALSGEHLGAELAAVFAGHRAFEAFHHRAHWRVVGGKMFSAILDGDVRPDAPEFVIRSLVGLLEASPAADVVNQNRTEFCLTAFYRSKKVLERVTTLNPDATLARIDKRAYDLDPVLAGETLDYGVLILSRVLLVVGRHAHVLGSQNDVVRVGSRWSAVAQGHDD